MARGGYQQPSNPAPASGPGQLSRRTDGGPAQKLRDVTGLPYGQNGQLNADQASAPLAQTPDAGAAPKPRAQRGAPPSAVTPLGAPTQRPDEPVTAGAALGPGPGPEALGLPSPATQSYQTALSTLQSVAATSGNSEVAALLNQMQARN